MVIGFRPLSFLLAALLAGLAFISAVSAVRTPDLWRRLPRDRTVGVVLALLCLLWCSIQIIPLLEGDMARFRVWIRLMVPAVTVLSFLYVDYLFTRALGGLVLLMVADLVHGAFVVHLPWRPLYAIVCYVVGVAGMFLIGMPWTFRDLLEKTSTSARWRKAAAGVLSFLAVFYAVFGMLGKQ